MKQRALFKDDSPLAARQPKTDRLILARLLKGAGENMQLDTQEIERAHTILVRWADFEKTGRLAGMTETQLQGDFCRDVFADALGYIRATENQPHWHLEQHQGQQSGTPDAVLGQFEQDKKKSPLAVIELKGSSVHLDRDRTSGRTAVDQCWDYLVDMPPACRWSGSSRSSTSWGANKPPLYLGMSLGWFPRLIKRNSFLKFCHRGLVTS